MLIKGPSHSVRHADKGTFTLSVRHADKGTFTLSVRHADKGTFTLSVRHADKGTFTLSVRHADKGTFTLSVRHADKGTVTLQSLPLAQSSRIQPCHVVLGTGFKRIRIRLFIVLYKFTRKILFIVHVQVYKEKTIYCPCTSLQGKDCCPCTSLQRKDLHNCISCSLHITGMCDDVARRYRHNSLLLPESVMMLPDTQQPVVTRMCDVARLV